MAKWFSPPKASMAVSVDGVSDCLISVEPLPRNLGEYSKAVPEISNMRKSPPAESNHQFPGGILPCALACFLITL